ncbi:MAG TPA: hypothetical protein DDZ76_12335 [Xanthomonadales bacterium]|nr:hypothetical protein [Xanthomonadales bacterium]
MSLKAPDRAKCNTALEKLLTDCEGARAAILALRDGRPYAECTKGAIDQGKFAAMVSSLNALGHSVLRELDSGRLDHVLIEGSDGKLVVSSVPDSGNLLILAVLAEPKALLGLVLGKSKACASAISAIIPRE